MYMLRPSNRYDSSCFTQFGAIIYAVYYLSRRYELDAVVGRAARAGIHVQRGKQSTV